MQGREIILEYRGNDLDAEIQNFWKAVREIEVRHLSYFLNRPGIFEEDAHERLRDHFFFIPAEGRIILLQAESSTLPSKTVAEVQDAFMDIFALTP